MKKIFKLIDEIQYDGFESGEYTFHAGLRNHRNSFNETIYKGFIVDRGHKDGLEAHFITTNASIIIYNYDSKRYITALKARPGQIKRYGVYNAEILNRAFHNVSTGLNKI